MRPSRRWARAVLLIGSVAAHALHAQAIGSVRGRVIDQNGHAVENAEVTLTPGARRTITVDNGQFAFASVRAGTYVLSARRIGYEPADVNIEMGDSTVTFTVTLVAIPQQLDAIQIREKSLGLQYSAVVLDEYDVPVADAQVAAMGVNRDLRTDLLGRFSVPKLQRGTLVVRIRKIGYAPYFDSFRVLADRADTIRMSRLATSLGTVEINEQSGFGNDESAYQDLDQRTRWKGSTVGSISREELAQQGGANLCDFMHRVGDANRFGLISQYDCARKFYRVLLDGAMCQTRKLSDFVADQVELIEYFPKPQNAKILFMTSDASENLARRGCPPEVFVIWTRHDIVRAATTVAANVAAAKPASSIADTANQHAQQAGGETQAAPLLHPGHLQGQVVDSLRHPVRAAVVYSDEPPRAALTDKNGYFRLAELPAGPVTIRVQRGGFIGTEFQLRLPPDSTVGIGVKLFPAAPALGTAQVDSGAGLEGRRVRVVSPEGTPIVYANVSIDGGATQVSDTKGEVSLGAGKREKFTMRVLRIGYAPWFGDVEVPSAAVVTVTLPRIALARVVVKGDAPVKTSLGLTGFYDRWLMRQKGTLSAVFIGPEELEFRHPDKIMAMLYGLNGIRISQACVAPPGGPNCVRGLVAFSVLKPGCPMSIVIDGVQQYPLPGALVGVDMLVDANEVAGVEVYARGGNMPINAQFQDSECGVLAFWTGSRR